MPFSSLAVFVSGRGVSRYSASSTSTNSCRRWRSSSRSPHAVLNVSPNASKDDIKASFRKVCLTMHPTIGSYVTYFSLIGLAVEWIHEISSLPSLPRDIILTCECIVATMMTMAEVEEMGS